MKKLNRVILLLMVVGTFAGSAFAEGTTFSPLNFSDAQYTGSNASTTKLAATSTNTTTNNAPVEYLSGHQNMQSAISNLDKAQVEVRNELLNFRTKYAEVDGQYVKIKNQRSDLRKQVRTAEKRIKQIDKQKDRIRKNMIK